MKITITLDVNAPLQKTFATFTDLNAAADNIKAIKKLTILTPGPVGLGTRFQETRMMFGKECTEEMTITHFESPHKIVIIANSHGSIYEVVKTFAEVNNKTRVNVVFEAKPQSLFARIMVPMCSWLMKKSATKALHEDLTCLQQVAEL